MIELRNNTLKIRMPDVHPDARTTINFQRTLRIPDDGEAYPLPPGLGRFPMAHVDDYAANVPADWVSRGGVMLPMYQAEALWVNFDHGDYPFAIKVATGKINAVTGEPWTDGLHRDPQDYVVVPGQPWLDGFCVEKGFVRQFVAMPLGAGYSAEEQITGEAEFGGLQIICTPMKRERYEEWLERRIPFSDCELESSVMCCESSPMGLAPGGRMRQEIEEDTFDLADWDQRHQSRCFIHLCNSQVWRQITGDNPPTVPPTSKEYTAAGLPWFDYYRDGARALEGSGVLAGLKSVFALGKAKGDVPLPENESVTPGNVIALRKGLAEGQVREGRF